MFEYVLEKTRINYWTYANISCAAYPLRHLDPVMEENGDIDTNSSLYILLNKHHEHHLELLDGVLFILLNQKWNTYLKYRFYLEFGCYIVYYILNSVSIFLKRLYYDYLIEHDCTHTSNFNHLKSECKCAYLYPTDSSRYVRFCLF